MAFNAHQLRAQFGIIRGNEANQNAASFLIGRAYFGRSIGDSDAIVNLTVAERTGKSIRTEDGKRLKIHISPIGGSEFVFPEGRHSKAMIVSAERLA